MVTGRVLTHGARGERGARGVLADAGGKSAGGTGRRGKGGGRRGKSPTLSVFIMIRDATML